MHVLKLRPGITAMVLALLAGVLTYGFLASWEAEVAIPVAAFDIPPATKVESTFIRTIQVPVRGLLPGVMTQPKEVVGRYTRSVVFSGETFVPAKLAGGNQQTAWKALLGTGGRAFSIPLDATRACGGALEPGDLADVYYAGNSQRAGSGQATRVLSGVPVLDLRDEDGNSLFRPGRPKNVAGLAGVIVQVTPAECSILALCIEQGHVYLAIAPSGSPDEPNVSVSIRDLLP